MKTDTGHLDDRLYRSMLYADRNRPVQCEGLLIPGKN